MAKRTIDGGFLTDEKINALSWFEQAVYFRLLVTADNNGVIDGRLSILKSTLFPLCKNVTEIAISEAVARTLSLRLLGAFATPASQQVYLYFPGWGERQRQRNGGKHPLPDAGEELDADTWRRLAAVGGGWRPMAANGGQTQKRERQKESEREKNEKERTKEREKKDKVQRKIPQREKTPSSCACARDDGTLAAVGGDDDGAKTSLPLVGGRTYIPAGALVKKWKDAFPAVNVPQELRIMAEWLRANPQAGKNERNILRFVIGWLNRRQADSATPKTERAAVKPHRPMSFDPETAMQIALERTQGAWKGEGN